MNVTVEASAPLVRCHECGSLRLQALCHHCWRPLCAEHARQFSRPRQWLFGAEVSGTGPERRRAYHCDKCEAHALGARPAVSAALAIAVAIFVVILAATMTAVAALVAAAVAVAAAGAIVVQARRRARARRRSAPMPVRPRVEKLSLTERLDVGITLDADGNYRSVPSGTTGKVEALLVFGRTDQERLERWMRRGPRGVDRNIRLTAGRLVLAGRAVIAANDQLPGLLVSLDAATGDFGVFRARDAQAASSWPIELPYELSARPDLGSGPMWITPSLMPGSDRRSMEFELQWIKLGPEDHPLEMAMIESFEVRYPVEWGEIEQVVGGSATVGIRADPARPGQTVGSITWTQLVPSQDEQQDFRKTLRVRFKERINLGQQIRGQLGAVFNGALSGVEDIQLFGSIGERRSHSAGARIRTRIDASFQLSLASIRDQAERVYPDHAVKDGDEAGEFAATYDVVPNDETVIELTDAMSDDGYYVKRVIENPPRSGGQAHLVQRYWDIACAMTASTLSTFT